MLHMNFKACVLALLVVLCARPAQAELSVFACEPEWASLASHLGGDKLDIFTATTALQDPHHIEARPSLIVRMRSADLLVCTGAELEVGWLPVLLRQASNARVQPGQPGHFMAAEQVTRLDVREHVSRDEGDVHAAGNPHVHLDPRRVLLIAGALHERLLQIDATNRVHYVERYEQFRARWQQAMTKWEQDAAPLVGVRTIVHHGSMRYLFDWLKIESVGDLEPKPGLPPSTAHLAKLLASAERRKPTMIVVARYQNPQGAEWLGDRAKLPVVMLPFTVGGDTSASDLFSLFDTTIKQLTSVVAR